VKIVLEFESLQDLEAELTKWVKAKKTGDVSELRAKPAESKPAESKPVTVPTPEPAPEPVEKVKGEEIMPAPVPQVDESYRVEVRRVLAKLNKKTETNTATQLIRGFGVEKLTEVALKDLPELMRQAEEALNA